MHPILNEELADKEVIKSLVREVARWKGKAEMRKITLFKDADGSIKQAIQFDTVTREEIVGAIDFAKENLAQAEQALVDFDAFAAANPAPVEEPVADAPVEDVPPAVQDPAPVSETPVTDTPATPAEQLSDPNVVPADQAPVAEPAAPVAPVDPAAAAPTSDPTPEPVTIA